MVDAGVCASSRDREVEPRIVQHPFRVIGFDDFGLGAEERRVEADAFRQIGHRDVHMETFHGVLLIGSTFPTLSKLRDFVKKPGALLLQIMAGASSCRR